MRLLAGDFNGDGRIDLAVACFGSHDADGNLIPGTGGVSVLLGNGDGTFQNAVLYAAGNGPDALEDGDFDGRLRQDGSPILDLATANYNDNTVSVLLGNGDGTFQNAVAYATGNEPDALVAGDWSGTLGQDGSPVVDLATANYGDNTVSVLLGNGNGTFQNPVNYAVGADPEALVAGDFSGNGRTDLAVANTGDNTVSVLLVNGNGTFQNPVNYAVGADPEALVAGDFSGNGRTDLAAANIDDNTVSVLLGNGDGAFGPQVTYTVGSTPSALVPADFNGDGQIDLAVTSLLSGTVSVLLGKGDGTFTSPPPGQVATVPHATPLVVDVNGDGTDDVLVTDAAGDILLRMGVPNQPGTFSPPVTVNPGNPSRDIAWLPSTDQGPVLASVDSLDDAISFYAYRDGGFVQLSESLTTGALPAQIVAADLNGDGLTDLVVRNAGDGTLSVFLGTAFDGPPEPLLTPLRFVPALTLDAGAGVSDVEAVDTTGDGAIDLVVTNTSTGLVSILPNLGGGKFGTPMPYRASDGLLNVDSSGQVTSLDATAGVVAAAFTSDGLTDLLTLDPGSNTLGMLADLGAPPVRQPGEHRDRVARPGGICRRFRPWRNSRPRRAHRGHGGHLSWQRPGGLWQARLLQCRP